MTMDAVPASIETRTAAGAPSPAGDPFRVLGIVVTVVGSTLVGAAQTCAQLGTGVHVVGSATYTCTPTSFYVHYGS